MSTYCHRPESALKRANEFIAIGKPAAALNSLAEVIKNKKFWSTALPEKLLEPVMMKFLELCVDQKSAFVAKEGLYNYRNMSFQSANATSLENVVNHYLNLAETRTELARQESNQTVVDVDDLDNTATPESILLRAVSGEDAKDRSDKAILTPWVKFLWESYRNCVELFRVNSKAEQLYHATAQQAFTFCAKYGRKNEFRKLSECLRIHLASMAKRTSAHAVDLTNIETQQLHLQTRLLQLDIAIQMELWQEAFRAIEDVHGFMTLAKKTPRPQTLAHYYQKLALVCAKAGNHLFHAAALFRLFQLTRKLKKNATAEELQTLGSRVLVAALATPLAVPDSEFDLLLDAENIGVKKLRRLAGLLHLNYPPTRASLINDLVRLDVVSIAIPQLQQLYQYLEVDLDPFHLCEKVQSVLTFISSTNEEVAILSSYVPLLKEVTLTRLVNQMAQLYSTIRIEKLLELAPFATRYDLEKVAIDAARYGGMQLRIDHRNSCLHFVGDPFTAQQDKGIEAPFCQTMPSEQFLTHLGSVYCVLNKSFKAIAGSSQTEEFKAELASLYHRNQARDRLELLNRQQVIEERRAQIEKFITEREEEEVRRQEKLKNQMISAEQKRLDAEQKKRERLRQEVELREVQQRHLQEKMAQLSQTAIGQKIIKEAEYDNLSKLNADAIVARQLQEMEKEKKELQAKLKTQEKRVDHFERAKRVEEIPLLKELFEKRQNQVEILWNTQENERIVKLYDDKNRAQAQRERLFRMSQDKGEFLNRIKLARRDAFEKELAQFEAKCDEMRAERLRQRKADRIEQRRLHWRQDKEAAERKRREEMAQRIREEEERKAKEHRLAQIEKARRERELADDILRKQREREREVEERMRQRDEEVNKGVRPKQKNVWEGERSAGFNRQDNREVGFNWRSGPRVKPDSHSDNFHRPEPTDKRSPSNDHEDSRDWRTVGRPMRNPDCTELRKSRDWWPDRQVARDFDCLRDRKPPPAKDVESCDGRDSGGFDRVVRRPADTFKRRL